jgi:hypothetical protein
MNRLFLHFAVGGVLYLSAVFIVVAEESHTSPFVAELKLQRPTFTTSPTSTTNATLPRIVIPVQSQSSGFVPKTMGELAKAPQDNAVWDIHPLLVKTGPSPDLWSAPATIFIGKAHWK